MLKKFLLTDVIPQLLKDGDRKSLYIQDPLRAAVIMLTVCIEHGIKMEDAELSRLCTALCLPKQNKDDFLQYWTDFSRDIAILKK